MTTISLRPEQVLITRDAYERAVIDPDGTLTLRQRHILLVMSAMGVWTLGHGGSVEATSAMISRAAAYCDHLLQRHMSELRRLGWLLRTRRGSGRRPPMNASVHAFVLPLHALPKRRLRGGAV